MRLGKKGFLEWGTIIEVSLLILSLIVIGGLWANFVGQAEKKTSEKLCEGFNALRMATEQNVLGYKFNVAPNACMPIDKGELPEDSYTQDKEGLKKNIADLNAKCWKMWLEGRNKDMFSKNWPLTDNGCQICYTFGIKKDIAATISEVGSYLDNAVYLAEDSSDRCYATESGYSGGFCKKKNDGTSPCAEGQEIFGYESWLGTKQAATGVCKENEVCCIWAKPEKECNNKGGQCRSSCETGEKAYTGKNAWQCGTGETCCVQDKYIYTYREYVQQYGGPGTIMSSFGLEFKNPTKYAVTFLSPKPELAIKGWIKTALYGAAGTAFVIYTGGAGLIYLAAAGAVTTAGVTTYTVLQEKDLPPNYLIISELPTVATKCNIEASVRGK